GSWTGSPTSFAYQWSRVGTPIQGATSSSYKVQRSDEGLSITCSVRASNASGASRASSSARVAVPVPKVKGCPAATGALRGTTLRLSAPIRVGLNTWYFAPNGTSNAIFKVRRGLIEELGIAQKSLTGTPNARMAFLKSFR